MHARGDVHATVVVPAMERTLPVGTVRIGSLYTGKTAMAVTHPCPQDAQAVCANKIWAVTHVPQGNARPVPQHGVA